MLPHFSSFHCNPTPIEAQNYISKWKKLKGKLSFLLHQFVPKSDEVMWNKLEWKKLFFVILKCTKNWGEEEYSRIQIWGKEFPDETKEERMRWNWGKLYKYFAINRRTTLSFCQLKYF